MRIVFFVHRYWPSVGGVEKYTHELAKALTARGHRVDVVAGATSEGLREHDVHEGVAVHRFPALRSPWRCRLWLWRRRPLFVAADVVHVSNTHMLEYFWRMLGPLVDRRKVFLTRHGMSCNHPVPESEKARAVRSRLLAAGVVHDGTFIGKWLGVEADLCPDQGLNPTAGELAPVPEPPPTSAVYIGRLEPDSGIRIYLDGVRRLTRDHGKTFSLDVFGDGSLAPALRRRVECERLEVRFHGAIPNAQDRIPDACFAFIDGRMAIQEAMARRRLVIAAFVDPLKRDYIRGESFSPYVIAVGDGEVLAERVAHYIDHAEHRRDLVARAFQHAQTLSWGKAADAYLALWRERLASPLLRTTLLEWTKLVWALHRDPSPSG